MLPDDINMSIRWRHGACCYTFTTSRWNRLARVWNTITLHSARLKIVGKPFWGSATIYGDGYYGIVIEAVAKRRFDMRRQSSYQETRRATSDCAAAFLASGGIPDGGAAYEKLVGAVLSHCRQAAAFGCAG